MGPNQVASQPTPDICRLWIVTWSCCSFECCRSWKHLHMLIQQNTAQESLKRGKRCNTHGRDLDVYHIGAVRDPDAQSALRLSTSDSANTTSRTHWTHCTIIIKTMIQTATCVVQTHMMELHNLLDYMWIVFMLIGFIRVCVCGDAHLKIQRCCTLYWCMDLTQLI